MATFGAPPALAAPGNDAVIVAEPFSAAPFAAGQAAAACPPGARATGGGVHVVYPGFLPTGFVSRLFDLQLSGPLDSTGLTANTDTGDIARYWYAYVYNNSNATQNFKTYAICSYDSDATIQADAFSIPTGSADDFGVVCPGGTRITGGGVGTTGPAPNAIASPIYNLELSGPLDATGSTALTDDGDIGVYWYSYIHQDTGATQLFKWFAICSAGSDAVIEKYSNFVVNHDVVTGDPAECPRGRRALGGGFGVANGPAPADAAPVLYHLQVLGPLDATFSPANTDDGDVAQTWNSYYHNTSGAAREFRTFALCASEPSGYPRPKGATPLRASLVPAYQQCATGNRTHGAPLSYPSCAPPQQSSGQLTIGSPDANGAGANALATATFSAILGNTSTTTDEADVRMTTSITDVRNKTGLGDYTGSLMLQPVVRLTDRGAATDPNEATTAQDFPFLVTIPCGTTGSTTIGSTCSLTTTADSVNPGSIAESRRAIWALDKVQVYDAGPDGNIATIADNAVFLRQGVFVP